MPSDLVVRLRLRVGQEHAHYGGDLVDGAFILRLFGDLITEISIRTDGDEGLLSEYSSVEFLAPVHPGDYLELEARLVGRTALRRQVRLEAHKVIAARYGTSETSAYVLAEPVLVCRASGVTVIPYEVSSRNRRREGE